MGWGRLTHQGARPGGLARAHFDDRPVNCGPVAAFLLQGQRGLVYGPRMRHAVLLQAGLLALLCSCAADHRSGTTSFFDLEGEIANGNQFYDLPYPSDLRLVDGKPELTGYPNPGEIALLADLIPLGEGRRGWSTTMATYFRFSAPLVKAVETDVMAGSVDQPILLIDVDPNSSERGRLVPTVARTLVEDDYVPSNVLAVAPRPGFILAGSRRYATVVLRTLGDAEGQPLVAPAALRELSKGKTPAGRRGLAAQELYAPLWETLDMIGIDRSEVAAATVFTTGDVVADLFAMSEALRDEYTLELSTMSVDPDDGDHERFCEIIGTVSFPQFQTGQPPYREGGVFELGSDGLPIMQRSEEAGVVLTLPKGEMPVGGYPLAMYFHGSGGLYQQVVDRGRVSEAGGEPQKGEGPAFVLAPHGLATLGSAHPLNPERLPGAGDTAYLNINNLASLPFTFAQGAIEQRLLLDALLRTGIPESSLAGCTGMSLPAGESEYHFADDKIVALGQSMGGMYTNIISAIEPRIKAVVPTGAGGLWHYFILETSLVPGAKDLLSVVFRTPLEEFTFLHPSLQLLALAWESAEPMVYMPRLAKDPLPGHPARPIYEPAGEGDSYFPTTIYDAAAISYGNQQGGQEVWSSMQEGLALSGRDGLLDYPVVNNLESSDGQSYTGLVVQYQGDGIYDPHAIYGQLDEVKYQYGCFLESFLARGSATVPAPAALGTPCP